MQFISCNLRLVCKKVTHNICKRNTIYKQLLRKFIITARLTDFSKWGTTKKDRKVKIQILQDMSDPKIEEILSPLRDSVKEQVNTIWIIIIYY